MKSPINRRSRMTVIRKLAPFLIVCRIGNLTVDSDGCGVLWKEKLCWLHRLNLNRRTPVPAHFVQMLRSRDELHVVIKMSNEKSAYGE